MKQVIIMASGVVLTEGLALSTSPMHWDKSPKRPLKFLQKFIQSVGFHKLVQNNQSMSNHATYEFNYFHILFNRKSGVFVSF